MNIDTFDDASTGSKGLVYIGDKVLIYRRDANTDLFPLQIDLPGGGSEGNETPYETFEREVHEEFGLMIPRQAIIYSRRYASDHPLGTFTWFLVAKLPAAAAQLIVFGNEGSEYFLLELPVYLDRTDAGPVMQARSRTYYDTLQTM